MSDIFKNDSVISTQWTEKGLSGQYFIQLGASPENTPVDIFANEKCLYGQFASVKKIDDSVYEAVRDPLGIQKLFYTETAEGQIHFSTKFSSLFQFKTRVFSVPPGAHVRIGASGIRELIRRTGSQMPVNPRLDINALREGGNNSDVVLFRDKYEKRLAHAFSLVRDLEDDGWTVFVALSGGLDSSIIAKKGVAYLSNPIACTLDLGNSEDAEKSVYIADHLGMEHLTFSTDELEILEMLDQTPALCQDFRDFNVHCAVLNLLLAKNIRAWTDIRPQMDSEKIMVLTGDLMNEYTCDYAGEVIDGVEYYKLPRIGKKALQSYLIKGLDTSDREISPFDSYGIKCVQPYSVVYDLFESLDGSAFEPEDSKIVINSFLADEEILKYIPKTKLRAQVGSRENMGILGICHKRGLNDKAFLSNLLSASGEPDGKIPIFVGKYDLEKFE